VTICSKKGFGQIFTPRPLFLLPLLHKNKNPIPRYGFKKFNFSEVFYGPLSKTHMPLCVIVADNLAVK
jgi:hypothetical protein